MLSEDFMHKRKFGYVNLNEASIWWEKKHKVPISERPFKDPGMAHLMEEEYHDHLGLDWSYGGWLEDRSNIRRGTYLEEKEWWFHTGIDVNVNEGTHIFSPVQGKILYAGNDAPLVGGWGKHVFQSILFRGKVHVLLYAHLGTIMVSEGTTLSPGRVIGTVGSPMTNGGWRPHLHLQLFAESNGVADWKMFSDEMDGYVAEEDLAEWARKCPDPTPLLFMLHR